MTNPIANRPIPTIFEIGEKEILCGENMVPTIPTPINIGHSIAILTVGFARRYLSKRPFSLISNRLFQPYIKLGRYHMTLHSIPNNVAVFSITPARRP